MLVKFMIENFEVFNKPVELSLEANMHTKKLLSNVVQTNQGNVLKSLAIYGPNNTCTIEAIAAFRDVLLNNSFRYTANVLSEAPTVDLGAEFICDGVRYAYSFSYNTSTAEFLKERFSRIEFDAYGNRKTIVYFEKDAKKAHYDSQDEKLADIIKLSSKDSILIYAFDTTNFPLLDEAKKALRNFADSLVILSMNRLSPLKTIEVLKQPESPEAKKVVGLIKAADMDIDDYRYSETVKFDFKADNEKDKRLWAAIKDTDEIMDQFRLISVHKGKKLPSIKFDSTGTKKIVWLASYIVEALDQGKTLILDELDSGLQFKLSRALISLFNNLINTSAQLICTTHDVSLLDIRTLLRKDQIWFTDKDREQAYLYSLSMFTVKDSGVRSDGDILEKYSKGMFGALPDPSLVEALLDITEVE